MTFNQPNLIAARDALAETIARRDVHERKLEELAAERAVLVDRIAVAQSMIDAAAKAARGARPSVGDISRLAAARGPLKVAEEELAAIEPKILDEYANAAGIDAALEERGATFKAEYLAGKAAFLDALQDRYRKGVEIIAEVCKAAAAVRGYIGECNVLDQVRLPYLVWPTEEFPGLPRQPMMNGSAAFFDGEHIIFAQAFSKDAVLMTTHRDVRALGMLADAANGQLERIKREAKAAERQRLDSDPAYRTEKMRQQREANARDQEENMRRQAEAQAKRDQEERDRHLGLADLIRRGEAHGTTYPGSYGSPIEGAQAEAYKIATGLPAA